VDTDLDALATALYVTCDDLLVSHPEHGPCRRAGGFAPAISDVETITVAVCGLRIDLERILFVE
jgi:hypothetical protein